MLALAHEFPAEIGSIFLNRSEQSRSKPPNLPELGNGGADSQALDLIRRCRALLGTLELPQLLHGSSPEENLARNQRPCLTHLHKRCQELHPAADKSSLTQMSSCTLS